jgi:hypothetical protein
LLHVDQQNHELQVEAKKGCMPTSGVSQKHKQAHKSFIKCYVDGWQTYKTANQAGTDTWPEVCIRVFFMVVSVAVTPCLAKMAATPPWTKASTCASNMSDTFLVIPLPGLAKAMAGCWDGPAAKPGAGKGWPGFVVHKSALLHTFSDACCPWDWLLADTRARKRMAEDGRGRLPGTGLLSELLHSPDTLLAPGTAAVAAEAFVLLSCNETTF